MAEIGREAGERPVRGPAMLEAGERPGYKRGHRWGEASSAGLGER